MKVIVQHIPEDMNDCLVLAAEALRLAQGLTQGEIAVRLGMTQSSYSRWVRCSSGVRAKADKLLAMGEDGRQIMKDALELARAHGIETPGS